MQAERRYAELRLEPEGVLTGVVVRYGDQARLPWGTERFQAGAFGDLAAVDATLNVLHDRARPLARTGGAGLELLDGADALELRAQLPETREAEDVVRLIKAGVLRGLSLEFAAEADRMEGGTRIVERARVLGVAVVDRPAYPDSQVSARGAVRRPPKVYL